MPRCNHQWAALFRTPDPAARVSLLLTQRAEFRRCEVCGRVETLARHARGGPVWRPVSADYRERLEVRVREWEAWLETREAPCSD